MSKSTDDNTKTRNKRPAQTGTLIGTRFQPDDLAKIDAWIAAQPQPFPTRPEAIRRLVEAGLSNQPFGELQRMVEKTGADIQQVVEQAMLGLRK